MDATVSKMRAGTSSNTQWCPKSRRFFVYTCASSMVARRTAVDTQPPHQATGNRDNEDQYRVLMHHSPSASYVHGTVGTLATSQPAVPRT